MKKMLVFSQCSAAALKFVACLLAFSATLVVHSRARAETALILPAGGDADADKLLAVENAVLSSLRQQGFAVSLHRDLAQTQTMLRQCVDLECTSQLPVAVRPGLAVAVAAWKGADAAGEPLVVVTLLDASGRYPAQAQAQQDLADAAQRALFQAQSLRLLGPGPWVSIAGAPNGADVIIDGERVGSLPYRGALAAGSHTLEVSAAGYTPHTEALEMPLKATHLTELELRLEKPRLHSSQPQSSAPAASTQPSMWNYVAGGALLAGAVGLAVHPLRNAANSGDCVGERDAAQRCSERVVFGGRSIGLTVAATALAFGSVYFFAFRPIHVEVDAAPHHAQARLRLSF